MRRLIARLTLTAGFVFLTLLASVGSSSGVSANPPYPDCGPAIPCGNYGYAPFAYNAPYYSSNAPYYAYSAFPVAPYAPRYFYDGVSISANVFTRNGCNVGNYTCLRNNGVRMSPTYAFGYVYR